MIQTISEFAARLGCKRQQIQVWGKRGKLVIIGGKIDDENGINKILITSRKQFISESGEVTTKSTKKGSSFDTSDVAVEQMTLAEAKLEKAREDVVFAKMKNEKISGKLISTDIVGRSTAEVILRYKSTFLQQVDQLIRDTLNSNGIDNKTLTETLSKLIDIANKASKRANQEAKYAIENSISDSLSLIK